MTKVINNRKIILLGLLAVLTLLFLIQGSYITNGMAYLTSLTLSILLYVVLCVWNDLKDDSVLLDKVFNKTLDLKSISSSSKIIDHSTLDLEPVLYKVLSAQKENLKEVLYDIRRKLYLYKYKEFKADKLISDLKNGEVVLIIGCVSRDIIQPLKTKSVRVLIIDSNEELTANQLSFLSHIELMKYLKREGLKLDLVLSETPLQLLNIEGLNHYFKDSTLIA